MKAGIVPLITRWDGGVDELVTDEITGYYFEVNASSDYVKCIKNLQRNRNLLQEHSVKCTQRANLLFNPQKNVNKIENIFIDVIHRFNKKTKLKVYGSRLDSILIPNYLTTLFRRLKYININHKKAC